MKPYITYGASLVTKDKGNIDLNIGRDIIAKGENGVIALNQSVEGGKQKVNIQGNVVAEGEKDAIGINVVNDDSGIYKGEIKTYVGGNVNSSGTGVRVWAFSESGNYNNVRTKIEVKGDVTAKDQGIRFEGNGRTDVIVDGTVKGVTGAVVIGLYGEENKDVTNMSNSTVTVWKLEPNQNGALVVRERRNDDFTVMSSVRDASAEKKVQYIIRVVQPEVGGRLFLDGGTYRFEGYDVAHEGDTVYVSTDMTPGWKIMHVYSDVAQTREMLNASDNTWYLIVPRGGGVSISALVQEYARSASIRPNYTVTYQEARDYDVYEPAAQQVLTSSVRHTVVLNGNGGTVKDGKTFTSLIKHGSSFTVPAPETREGVEFQGWSSNTGDVLEPNTTITIDQDTTLTAIWKNQ